MTQTTTSNPRRGEVWWVNFDPSVGAEQQKVRPALVMSTPAIGKLPLRIVVPVTSWKPRFANQPWIVHLPRTGTNGLLADSGADAFQVKSVSLDRFATRLGCVTSVQLDEIAAAVALCVGFRLPFANK